MNDWFEAEQRIERAQQLSESLRWAEALAEIDAALAINPHNAAWLAQRGCILEELDRVEDAAEAYRASLALDEGDRDVAVALGMVLARLGRLANALEVFGKLAKTVPLQGSLFRRRRIMPSRCLTQILVRDLTSVGQRQRGVSSDRRSP